MHQEQCIYCWSVKKTNSFPIQYITTLCKLLQELNELDFEILFYPVYSLDLFQPTIIVSRIQTVSCTRQLSTIKQKFKMPFIFEVPRLQNSLLPEQIHLLIVGNNEQILINNSNPKLRYTALKLFAKNYSCFCTSLIVISVCCLTI